MTLQKGNEKINIENENHIVAFLDSGWKEPAEKPAPVRSKDKQEPEKMTKQTKK